MMKTLRIQNNAGHKYVTSFIPKDSTVLDLGCGCGNPFKGATNPLLVGLDIFKKEFDMPEYDLIVFQDALKMDELFLENSFDVVVGIDFIEHLLKEDGFKVMEKAEKVARSKVIFFTPKKWTNNKVAVEDSSYWSFGNQHNLHQSHWVDEDFKSRGYEIKPCQGFVLAVKEMGK